jgi:L-threonylcarbamoyladenylate synthase
MPIETRVIETARESWLEDALQVLRGGGLVAFPTDTVYGVGGLADAPGAVEAIFRAKERPEEKGVPVLLGGWTEVSRVATPVPRAARLAARFWPGPLTLVLPRQPQLPQGIGPAGTVGVRAPNHPVALALLAAAGPIATSSANRSGGASPQTADEVLAALGGRIDMVIDGGVAPGGRPSTVVDCTGEAPTLIRPGPIDLEEVLAAW